MTLRRSFAFIACVACLGGSAQALTPQQLLRQLPRTWCGSFVWTPKDTPQLYRVFFREIALSSGGKLKAWGEGINYSTSRGPTRVTFTAEFDPRTHEVRMWEKNPVPPSPSYITSGHFDGRINARLNRIEAVWVDRNLRLNATRFVLEAGPGAAKHAHCADSVS